MISPAQRLLSGMAPRRVVVHTLLDGMDPFNDEQAPEVAAPASAVEYMLMGRLQWDKRRKRRDEALLLGRRWDL